MLINAPLQEHLKVLPLIFDDPEHPLTPFWEKAIYIIYHARQVNDYWLGLIVFSIALTLQTRLCKTISLGFSLTCGVVIALLLSYRVVIISSIFPCFPLVFLACFVRSVRRIRKYEKCFFQYGFLDCYFRFAAEYLHQPHIVLFQVLQLL